MEGNGVVDKGLYKKQRTETNTRDSVNNTIRRNEIHCG